ncbi:MAG: hypothetical protein ACM34I_02895 [bacterium]
MKILKYLGIDFLGVVIFFLLQQFWNPYSTGSDLVTYVEMFIVCFTVGILFREGPLHGISMSFEIMFIVLVVLYMVGRPTSTPVSELIRRGIVFPLLPLPLIGLVAGFVGEKIILVLRRKKGENQDS